MFTKKLNALQYTQPFNIEDETDYRNLVYFLENMKIRFYPPEDRDDLLVDAPNWNDNIAKYLKEIGYAGAPNEKVKVADFLLNLALQYETEDTREKMQLSKENISDLVKVNTASDLTRIDVNSSQFIDGLRELSSLLNVPFYQEEPLVTLRAIAILLKRLKKSTVSGAQTNIQTNGSKRKKLTNQVDESVLKKPFSKTAKYDPLLNRAANVLRLLYIKDLRELQTQINAMIVQVQSLTANPKTDTALGKVGR